MKFIFLKALITLYCHCVSSSLHSKVGSASFIWLIPLFMTQSLAHMWHSINVCFLKVLTSESIFLAIEIHVALHFVLQKCEDHVMVKYFLKVLSLYSTSMQYHGHYYWGLQRKPKNCSGKTTVELRKGIRNHLLA